MPETIDYKAVIADLESRRAAFNSYVDNAVNGIRQILALTASIPDLGNSGAPGVPIDSDGFLGLTLLDAIKKYLRLTRRKLTAKEISEGLDRAGFVHTSKDFANTVGTALWRADKDSDKDVFRQGRYWLLSEWAPGRRRPNTVPQEVEEEESDLERDEEKTMEG